MTNTFSRHKKKVRVGVSSARPARAQLLLAGIVSAVCLLSQPVFAGGSEGHVETPLAHVGDLFMFSAGSMAGTPSCATARLSPWVVSLKTEWGRAVQSLVMLAYAQGKRVHVQGAGNCDVWADRETVNYVFILD